MENRTSQWRSIFFISLLVISTITLFAQEKFPVTGKITDDAGKPIVGVSVQVKGTSTTTVTNPDGTFQITAPSGTSTLVISSVGFTQQEIPLNNRKEISLTMSTAVNTMQDIVVVGYGTRRRGDVTGSISSVTSEEIRQIPTTNVSQALQGRVPGLVVTPNSFRPGSSSSIRIRGARSLTANNNPLFVVDGIPLSSENAIDEINPLDIESIDVLKDASATAIYGARGANGVIQVTTKKGKAGKVSIEYSGSVSFDKMLAPLEVFDGAEWADEKRQGYFASKAYTPTALATSPIKYYFPDPVADYALFFTKGDIYTWRSVAQGYTWVNQGALVAAKRATTAAEKELMKNLGIAILDSIAIYDPSKVGNFDWQDETIRTGITQNHNISLTAGSEKFRTAFSGGYFKQKGIEYGQDYTRYTFMLNNEIRPAKWINVGTNISYAHAIQNIGPSEYGGASGQIPLAQPYDSNGKLIYNPGNDPNIFNPLNDQHTVFDELKIGRVLANIYTEIQLYKGLKYRPTFGIDIRNEREGTFNGSVSSVRAGTPANASYTTRERLNWTFQNMLTYETRFGRDHSFSALVAQEMLKNRYETNTMSAENLSYESQKWYSLQNNSLGTVTGFGDFRQYQLLSYLGRVNYGFKDRYLLTFSIRDDNSSVLAEGHKGEIFPSGSAAWIIDKESFMQGINAINTLKLRVGYGEVGNSSIDPYLTGGQVSRSLYNWGNVGAPGYTPSSLPLPDLTWERTKTKNIGLDFGILKNRITGTLDFYESNSNQIQNKALPAAGGIQRVTINLGNVRNKGFELNLNTVNINKPNGWRWTTEFVYSRNKQEVTDLGTGVKVDLGNQWFVGEPTSIYYDWKFMGIFQYSDTLKGGILADYFWKKAGNKANANFQPGRAYIKDMNGDTSITEVDKIILGSHNPAWIGSFASTVSFKGFDLRVYVYGQFGSLTREIRPSLNARNQSFKVNYWTPTNPSNEYAQPNNTIDIQQYWQSMGFRSADFVRVRDISLTYHIPSSFLKRYYINNMSLSFNAVNPFLFADYETVDVETVPYKSSYPTSVNSGPTVNSYSYRSYVFSLRIGL